MANFGGQNVLLHSCIKCYDKSERSDLLVGRICCYTVVLSVMISQKDLTCKSKGVIFWPVVLSDSNHSKMTTFS